jgi:glycosyltransferase involved in cell wall biosynthesis
VHLQHAARRADRVICVSRHAALDVEQRLGVGGERITVVPHGISPSFAPIEDDARRRAVRRRWVPEGAYLVSFVGTAQPRKRVEVAVQAVERLRNEGLPALLVIAGRRRPGYEPDWMSTPPACVRLAGELSQAELVELYAASDVMVSPSSFEGFGLTFAEAMACGCPVVGVDATSVPEVVGDGGLLVERPDPVLVARALAALLRDPEERAALSARARARALEFSWERAARRTLEVYRRAAEG